jgi:hypothetical protein
MALDAPVGDSNDSQKALRYSKLQELHGKFLQEALQVPSRQVPMPTRCERSNATLATLAKVT